MKVELNTALALILWGFSIPVSVSQEDGYVSEMYLKGKWNATCAIEVINQSGYQYCKLCSIVDNESNNSRLPRRIRMNFYDRFLEVMQDRKKVVIPIEREADTHAFSFTIDDSKFHFRMQMAGTQRILVDSEGLILVLESLEE